jgi:probable F420-dependent oxidoreductase
LSAAVPDPDAHRFRFGLGPAGLLPVTTARQLQDLGRKVEDLGYHALCFGDHMDSRPSPGHAAVALAQWTTTLRVAVHIFANDFRHPAVLAKELSTIAALTDGRFDAGIGAGWMATDYDALGLPFDPPALRIDRLAEAVEIVKASWQNDTVDFNGRHYRVEGLAGRPLLGGVAPPMLVMGGGGRRMLALAARQADVVSINVRLDAGKLGPDRGVTATHQATEQKLAVVRDAAGDRFDDLVLQVEIHHVDITDDRDAALARAGRSLGLTATEILASPHVLIGSVDQVCERLIERREEFGISYICMSAAAADAFAPVVARLAGT